MTNNELRESLQEAVMDEEILNEMIILEGDEFADGAVGVSQDNRVIYDYDLLVESLMKHDGLSLEESVDMLEYNTMRALPYMKSQGRAPIIMTRIQN